MTQIARYDWLPERARCSYLARSGLPALSRKQNYPENHIINMPEFLKTGLAKIRTHSTTWQLKTTRFIQRPIKKPISDAGQ